MRFVRFSWVLVLVLGAVAYLQHWTFKSFGIIAIALVLGIMALEHFLVNSRPEVESRPEEQSTSAAQPASATQAADDGGDTDRDDTPADPTP